MRLLLAALALVVSQDGGTDIPPPRPIPTKLAATFAGAVRRHPAFAAVGGRVIQPGMEGSLDPGSQWPAWVVEIHWKEEGKLRTGVAMLVDMPAYEKMNPGTENAIPLALREGPWFAVKISEDLTFASWAEQSQERRSVNEVAARSDIRFVISAQAVFQSASGSFGEMRCLSQPATCLPGTKQPAMLDATTLPAETLGYRRTFHPGAPVKGKGRQTGLIATWAYTAEPIDGSYGRQSFCGDFTGIVCAVAGTRMPPVVGGACPKSCLPIP
jgi:hypothetical protein